MDPKIKAKVDSIFEKYDKDANVICLALYGDRDYSKIAERLDWEDYIEDFSYEQSMERDPPKGLEVIQFANLGQEQFHDDGTEEDFDPMIKDVNDLANDVAKMIPWKDEDFNGEVNSVWFGIVAISKDYKVFRLLTNRSGASYVEMLGDMLNLGSKEEEAEKNAVQDILNRTEEINASLVDVKTQSGKDQVITALKTLLDKISAK
jgi:hypothetical protein